MSHNICTFFDILLIIAANVIKSNDYSDFITRFVRPARFSYVLEDLDVDAAVYFVGGESYGYGRDCDGEKIEFGISVPAALLAVVAKEKPGRCGYPCRPGWFLYCRLRKSAEGL